jgi:hypothetical protein
MAADAAMLMTNSLAARVYARHFAERDNPSFAQ